MDPVLNSQIMHHFLLIQCMYQQSFSPRRFKLILVEIRFCANVHSHHNTEINNRQQITIIFPLEFMIPQFLGLYHVQELAIPCKKIGHNSSEVIQIFGNFNGHRGFPMSTFESHRLVAGAAQMQLKKFGANWANHLELKQFF